MTHADSNPRYHTENIRQQLGGLIKHLREDVEKVGEPQAKAMFETSAEVLAGLVKAFEDYERKNEAAWRR